MTEAQMAVLVASTGGIVVAFGWALALPIHLMDEKPHWFVQTAVLGVALFVLFAWTVMSTDGY